MLDLSLNHFSPQVLTPLECCAVRLDDMRQRFNRYYEPEWPTTGAFIHIEKKLIPSPMQAVQQAVLMRAADPEIVRHVATAKHAEDIAGRFPDLVGWQDKKPAPWIRRLNDTSKRVETFYRELYELTSLRPPKPSGYEPFTSEPDIFTVPVADFGKKKHRKKAGVSKRLAMEL